MSFPGFKCGTMEFTQLFPLSTSPLAASMTTANASPGLPHFQNMQKYCTFTMLLFVGRINQVSAAHCNTIQENFLCSPSRYLRKHFAKQCTKYEHCSKSLGRWSSQPGFSHSAHRVFCCYKCLYIEGGPILHWNLLQWTDNPKFPIYSTNE